MRLFKYLHPDRTDVLREAMIRFSSPHVLNDPFELKPNISAFSSGWVRSQMARISPEVGAKVYAEATAETRAKFSVEEFQAILNAVLSHSDLEAPLKDYCGSSEKSVGKFRLRQLAK